MTSSSTRETLVPNAWDISRLSDGLRLTADRLYVRAHHADVEANDAVRMALVVEAMRGASEALARVLAVASAYADDEVAQLAIDFALPGLAEHERAMVTTMASKIADTLAGYPGEDLRQQAMSAALLDLLGTLNYLTDEGGDDA